MTDAKFKKGQKRGPGRPKGTPNKLPAELKAMILQALERSGGVDYLVKQANAKNPAPFMALVGKVLPLQVTGEGGGPIEILNQIAANPKSRLTV